jgi:hypothetical protein
MKKCLLPFFFVLSISSLTCKHSSDSDGSSSKKKFSKSLDLYLPEDLEATLWAQSPMFYNPTNMDVDIKGRIWITEAVNYRNFNNDSAKAFIIRRRPSYDSCMYTNGDGKAIHQSFCAVTEDRVSPLGLAVIGNK